MSIKTMMSTKAAEHNVLDRVRKADTANKPKTKRPPMYNVMVLNDHTTMPHLVEELICKHFNRSASVSRRIMMEAHMKGLALVNVYSKEVAEEKVAAANTEAGASDQHARSVPRCELKFTAELAP